VGKGQALDPTSSLSRQERTLAIVIDGANRHDMKLLCATLDGIVIARPEATEAQPQHLCLDAGYDYPATRREVEDHQYVPHIRSRGAEKQEKISIPGYRARRWVVERTHSWINRSRLGNLATHPL